MGFKIVSELKPAGSQPKAIEQLVEGIHKGKKRQTLLGVTGSGKTFTMAKVIEKIQKPTLVLAHNKTLAAQLYSEFKDLFPENAIEYFVSYYDYYQPEAYLPSSDTYIEKDADINNEIEKLRHRTTASLLDRKDVLVVATVSSIYGLGSPDAYESITLSIKEGDTLSRDELIRNLVQMHYDRNDSALEEGRFRVRGGQVDIMPPYGISVIRIKLDDEIESITEIDTVDGSLIRKVPTTRIFPAVHYVLPEKEKDNALEGISHELKTRLAQLEEDGKMLEANRLKQKTTYDIELIKELGYCKGIENYSRHLEGRACGEPPNTLIDFYPDDWLCFIDESHMTVPQIRGMHAGDKSRKETLVAYGFRLPSALDNRPLNYDEFDSKLNQVVYVSATPSDYEKKASDQIVEQIIRPTGLVDPPVEVRPATDQVKDFVKEAEKQVSNRQRALATTLTKRMSEDLSEYLGKKGFKVKYLHSEIDTLDRVDILRELREGGIDVIVGVNLLREGIDLPEVALVAIMDADQEGFLRSETSLVQTIGRCSRNIEGRVILYADKITGSMERALKETKRRRTQQLEYNKRHDIKPASIRKKIHDRIVKEKPVEDANKEILEEMPTDEIERLMKEAAENMDFEQAIMFRTIIKDRKKR